MKKIVYLLCFISITTYTQTSTLDSLETEIENYQKIDTTLISKRTFFFKKVILEDPSRLDLLEYADKTMQLSEELKFEKGKILTYQHKGIVYQYFKNDDIKAIEYYQKSLAIIDKNPHLKKLKPSSLNNIGGIYINREEYSKALDIYRKVYKEFKNSETIPEQYLGLVFANLKQLDSAIYYLRKAVDKAEKIESFITQANSYSNLSKVLLDNNQPEEAKKTIELTLDLAKKRNVGIALAGIYANATEIYLFNKDYELAEYYAKKLLEEPFALNNNVIKKFIYATLYEVYEEKKDYKKALEAHIEFKKYNDSLIAIDERVALTKRDLELESERKELLAKAEITKQKSIKNLYLIIGSVILIIIVLLFFFIYQRKKAKEATLKANLLQSKLIALKSQLNPHFIFNALNSINQYIITNEVKDASSYLIKFSELMRNILHSSEKNWVLLSEEIELMRVYIEIESLRLQNSIVFKTAIDANIDVENTLVPTLFIQPFIENSIEHGISKTNKQGIISFSIHKLNDSTIKCIIEDNGIGRNGTEKDNNHKSVGIKIARERMDYINQINNSNATFNIEYLDEGVKVMITIPYKTKF